MNVLNLLGGVRATGFFVALVAALAWGGYQRSEKQDAEHALTVATLEWERKERVAQEEADRKYNLLKDFTVAAFTIYEEKLDEAEAKRKAVVADLQSARLQLRREWTCPLPGATDSPGQVDGDAQLRREGAAAFVRDGAEADAWIKALQSILKKYEDTYGKGVQAGSK